ncbi:MAG: hypothetical protein EAZ97_14655 [Bacteroidetes bacterium]|nr:MAG: hypothetical protein EAZ97_14655 [Bacteroidota bacterium]
MLYIKQIEIQNLGAIENLNIEAQFDQGNPYPIILVGKNGTGKTLLLSNILDSFIELKRLKYDELSEVKSNKYLKLGSKSYIKSGKEYSFSKITLSDHDNIGHYIDFASNKSGKDILQSNPELNNVLIGLNTSEPKFQEYGFAKQFFRNTLSLNILENNVLIFLPHSRYDHPAWLNNDTEIGFEMKEKYLEHDKTNVIKTNILKEVETWILDCCLDRELFEKALPDFRDIIDIISKSDKPLTDQILLNFIISLQINLKNKYSGKNSNIIILINNLFTIIYKAKLPNIQHARIGVGEKNRRTISIIVQENGVDKIIANSFSHLSSGEIMLLCLFTSIIKEYDNLGKNFTKLEEIEGIVVIDEIDLHLHIEFQKIVLPQLIKLFPKVQFIISTHSPFFLMGMDKEFAGKCSFINMPEGNQIQVSQFSEVNVAYDVFTQGFQQMQKTFQEVNAKLQTITKTLVITEGKTDWKHLKNALRVLQGQGKYVNLDFEFLEYEDNISMGDSHLETLCKQSAKMKQNRKMICLFDRDVVKYIQEMSGTDDLNYKNWGNNVYSLCIPVPSHRQDYKNISIEFYYTDSELKTIDMDTKKRLYFSNELQEDVEKNLTTGKSIQKIKTLSQPNTDDEFGKKIYDQDVVKITNENGVQVAHSKNNFAENILKREEGFDNFDVTEFCKIFDIIEKIINC